MDKLIIIVDTYFNNSLVESFVDLEVPKVWDSVFRDTFIDDC